MRLFSIFFMLIGLIQNCHSHDNLEQGNSAALRDVVYSPLLLHELSESHLRDDIVSQLSPGLCTKATLYPVHHNLEQYVSEVLNILSGQGEERDKIQSLNELVQRAMPNLLEEINVGLDPQNLLATLSKNETTQQDLVNLKMAREQSDKIIFLRAQSRIILRSISQIISDVAEEQSADSFNYNVYSTLYPDKIRSIERVLKSHKLENLDDFAQAIDRGIFANTSQRVWRSSLFFASIGFVPSAPSCGYLMFNAATFLGIPPDHPSATAMIVYILAATTPVFVRQFYDFGKSLTSSAFDEVPFVRSKKESGLKPHRFERNIFHKGVNTLLVGNAFITALMPTLLMKRAEIQFPLFFAFTVGPFFTSLFESALTGGIDNADRIFTRYFYTSPQTEVVKEMLRGELQAFLSESKKNDELARRVSMQIEEQRRAGFPNREDNPFLFSCFFVKSINQSTSYLPEVDIQKPVKSKDTALWLSTILTGMGSYGRYILFQSVFEELMGNMGVSPQWSTAISIVLSLGETLYRNMCSHAQEEFFLKGTHLFSSETNLTFWRKTATLLSCVSGLLFSVPGLVAGLDLLKNYSTVDKIAILGPAFLLDFSSYQPFFEIYYLRIITDFATTPVCSYTNHHARLVHFAEKVDDFIVQADVQTTETLWGILKEARPRERSAAR